ncbi:hypothetical protein H4R19_001103 [Coemansia spiralis]|nr:hypothetical protein H4R19_001103 [Coemansia spiralis]
MRFASLTVGLVAVASLLSPATGSPMPKSSSSKADSINYTCAYRNGYQMIGYLNTRMAKDGDSYCRAEQDNGYVGGIIRFTVQYGSALAVVEKYMEDENYKEEFKDVYEELKKRAAAQSTVTDGFDDFCVAWKKAATNGNSFFDAQMAVARNMYEIPALNMAKRFKLRFKYPLTRFAVTQFAITGGIGEDDRTIGGIMKATNAKITADVTGESNSQLTVGTFKVDEIEWLKLFMDKASDAAGAYYAPVVKVLNDLITKGNYNIGSTTRFKGFDGKTVTLQCTKLKATQPKPTVKTDEETSTKV